ncbi:MAG TPA: 3-deoxy-D-manno-octulosonate 8-phosphate phosphatase [Saprospiraceae bacterium]|jgi:3-deoxy-D-manno-octulosonate 8-phosphate phosphatase (KDO 8-P phosphatase)|nr:3-deoxy-D-manno-octulosonate 8-phosphate phosphatase [Saprospiraceae bacterium]MBK6667865.1 3-deoxy-D-manno-octulosonate 8-phosphate phosphatase [Saprospiraceae bacterium]MBK7698104.1 3-deoxy-D-manno-octulosonate 8-phosphate phosphatase [Saprospiraceae bacterium]MBK8827529.1 3-deoxy-D-manno-octulosonate 8-phosphate phosphatase [Saprospiraceae bacterium]MBK8885259.1 3-deoxy-D-manno-octulosonate 8-phosphate phosphatase [Saprospiraceae bacterium]
MDHSLFNYITTFVFDVDGVFTNGEVIVTESGELLRTMSTRDGQAVKIAMENGYQVAIITKGFSTGVRKRFELLGIPYIYDKLAEKTAAFDDLAGKLSLKKQEILFMGDDIPDLVLYDKVGISACPADAAPENLQKAMYISPNKGGHGCVREVIERVMRLQGKWNF